MILVYRSFPFDGADPAQQHHSLFPCSTHHWFNSGLETLLLGGACATVAYTIGQLVDHMIGDHGDGAHLDL